MRNVLASSVCLAGVLLSSTSMANATFTITISGQPSAPSQVIDSDPVALSGSLGVESNMALVAGFGSAAADCTAGTVRVRSTGGTKIDGAGFPNVVSYIGGKITFHGPGPTVQAQVKGTVDGVFLSTGSGIGFLQQVAGAQLTAGSSRTSVEFERDYTTSMTDPAVETFTTTIQGTDGGFDMTHPTTGPEAATLLIDTAFAVETPISLSLQATAQLGAQGAPNNVSIDDSFGNTARLTITLPDGYTFTSADGVFLTDPGGPGLALPPDGGPGVHGTGSGTDGGGGTSGDGGGGGGGGGADAGGGSNADNGGSSSSGGCNSAGSAAGASFSIFAVAAFSMLFARRRRARRDRREQ